MNGTTEVLVAEAGPMPSSPEVGPKRCWRPKWEREMDKQNKAIRKERREAKRREREIKAKKREERRKKRERREQFLIERQKKPKDEFVYTGRVCYCGSCRKMKREVEMFSEDKCYACEYSEEVNENA